MLKRILTVCFMAFSVCLGGQFLAPADASAQDVWVCTAEGKEIYVETDTIRGNSSYATVRTKEVYDGRLVRRISWEFDKNPKHMWCYQTNTMDRSHSTTVIPNGESHAILNECGKVLGFSTYVREYWVY